MENKRVIALDIGTKRIGIAMSDIMGIIASPHESYIRQSLNADLLYLSCLIKKHDAVKVICGLPVSMDGSMNAQAEYTKVFAEKLKTKIDVPLEYTDERFTTKSAKDALLEFDVNRQKRKEVIDKVAASIILQSYLNRKI
ncbi:MAG: Holliday junction resolvase RuvX [Firmicutes bacterium]|nr:Holliday junction resolvase RuvX [Bacillota bacterium]